MHIADVSYFVRAGTAIDTEAAARANTTYLVERRLDMLPGLLTETLCSLKGGVDRFAFTVTWEFRPRAAAATAAAAAASGGGAPGAARPPLPTDAVGVPTVSWEAVPGATRFFKSIIHSRAALTYAAAQTLLDAPPPGGAASAAVASAAPLPATGSPAVAAGLKLLASIARSLRADRKDAGALTLGSAEVRFLLDSETHEPLDVSAYELRETNSMVEEFMCVPTAEGRAVG